MYRLKMYRRVNGLDRLMCWFDYEMVEAMKFLKMSGYEKMGRTPNGNGDKWINNAYRCGDDVVDAWMDVEKIDENELENQNQKSCK